MEPTNEKREPVRAVSPWSFMGLGIEVATPIILGLLLGWRADLWVGTSPWLVVVGALLGMAMSFYVLFRRALPQRRTKR